MPRAHLVTTVPQVPLTVSAVSEKLGVSASTLRTWERRYGLGPGHRQAGTRRRYLPEDVARLTRMVELMRTGASAAAAAAVVLAGHVPAVDHKNQSVPPKCTSDLAKVARATNIERVAECLESAVADYGLVHTWTRLVAPAMETLRADEDGEIPAAGPSSVLTCALMNVLREIYEQRPPSTLSPVPNIVIMTDMSHSLPAQVVGVALAWYGMQIKILRTEGLQGVSGLERFSRHVQANGASLAIVMGTGASCSQFVSGLTDSYDIDVVLVGADTPQVLDNRVTRVRTAGACVEEVIAQLAPDDEIPSALTH
ncbi:MerR family transcriptional regulator [Schaalia vaccimaxillae]|uniref:MerR family transcriptional regulator n=1 Tax=Schaalia vaccimaxillae TaxID=183916 RepID=UPI0003B6C8A7|nr:MerR family transcriptional regulator [Schaalia vaccimaxillae]